MRMCKVVNVKSEWTTAKFIKKVEEKLLELTYEGWGIMNVSFSKNGWGNAIAFITIGTTDEVEERKFKIDKVKDKSYTALAKKVDDEMMHMLDSYWDVISASFTVSSMGNHIAYITISRAYDDDFV